jgi:tripartite-type tricarboxylate transporter receptor subunit TctC
MQAGGAQEQLPPGSLSIYVGFPAGTATDNLARAIAEHVQVTLGRPVIVLNQPGATGMISLERLKRAPAQGSVVGIVPLTSGLVAPMFKIKPEFSLIADFEPVIMVGQYALVFMVAPSLDVASWPSFLNWCKSNGSELLYGHGGTGSLPHLMGASLASAAGLKGRDVPFKGDGEVLASLLGGQIPSGLVSVVSAKPLVQGKRLNALAVTSRLRDPGMPDVPTFVELGYPAAVSENWVAIFAPRGTPPGALSKWNEAINGALRDSDLRQTMSRQGYVVGGGTAEALRVTVAADADHWRKVMDEAGFKATD